MCALYSCPQSLPCGFFCQPELQPEKLTCWEEGNMFLGYHIYWNRCSSFPRLSSWLINLCWKTRCDLFFDFKGLTKFYYVFWWKWLWLISFMSVFWIIVLIFFLNIYLLLQEWIENNILGVFGQNIFDNE